MNERQVIPFPRIPKTIEHDDDGPYQEGAARYQQRLLEDQLAGRAPLFWLIARYWLVILLASIAIALYNHHHHRGHAMSNPDKQTPAPQTEPSPQKTLPGTIAKFAQAVVAISTHPDTRMFFFDAQEVTVNERLETMKFQALLDSLCAAGIVDRTRWENRLEELLLQATQRLEEAANRVDMSALVNRGRVNVNGSDH